MEKPTRSNLGRLVKKGIVPGVSGVSGVSLVYRHRETPETPELRTEE
jgi:hypothetical protein